MRRKNGWTWQRVQVPRRMSDGLASDLGANTFSEVNAPPKRLADKELTEGETQWLNGFLRKFHRAIRVPSCALDSNRLPKNTRVRASDDFSSASIRMGSSFLRQNGQFSRHLRNSRSSESRSRSGCESRSFVSGSCWTYSTPLLVLTMIISSQSLTPNITSRKSSPHGFFHCLGSAMSIQVGRGTAPGPLLL